MKNLITFLLGFILITPPAHAGGFFEINDDFHWNMPELDTARNETYLSVREKNMILEINVMRRHPDQYVHFIETHIQNVKKTMQAMGPNSGGTSTVTSTINGVTTVTTFNQEDTFKEELNASQNLITRLKTLKPGQLKVLKPLPCIFKAASAHGKFCKQSGELDHIGLNGSTPWDRITAACNQLKWGNENLTGGQKSVRQAAIDLLVDAGIPGYGHRENVLDPDWEFVSVYESGAIGDYPTTWIQNYGSSSARTHE